MFKRTLNMSLGNFAMLPSCVVVYPLSIGGSWQSSAFVNKSMGFGSLMVSICSEVVFISRLHVVYSSLGLAGGPLGGLRSFMGTGDGFVRDLSFARLMAVVSCVGYMSIKMGFV